MIGRVRGALSPAEWARAGGLAAAVIGLHVVGFGLLFGVVVPHHFSLGAGGAFTAGVGLTAYTLGLRHAFDADHIAAIDNTTRKLMNDGQRPLGVGFFFSLGHSTVVFALALLFALGVRALAGQVQDDGSTLHSATGLIGTGVSGAFLYVIAGLNLVVLVGIVRVLRDMRGGTYSEAELEELLRSRGLMNRLLGRFTNAVTKPWQMYPLGVLFGLGFDTATEVALLFLAAGAAGAGLPWYAILCLPVLFAAGHVAAGHDRRLVHELRLRLGLLPARAQGLLQPHGDRPLGGRGAGHRHHRAALDRRRAARPVRRLLGLGRRHRPQRASATSSSACSSPPGRSRSPCGASGTSRSAGRSARARVARGGPNCIIEGRECALGAAARSPPRGYAFDVQRRAARRAAPR